MKQKDNTQSFKETELSGVGDTTVTIIWLLYFIRTKDRDDSSQYRRRYQECHTSGGDFQDVQQQADTAHHPKPLFIADKVDNGDITISHTSSEDMQVDRNTRPDMGTKYQRDGGMVTIFPLNLASSQGQAV